MRNEYARALAKEVQKLWMPTRDIKKLKEAQTAQFAELAAEPQRPIDFQMQYVQALSEGLDERHGDSLLAFRNALRTYKSGKPRQLIEAKLGATARRSIFESVRRQHGESYVDKAREELADSLYNGLEEEAGLSGTAKSLAHAPR